MITPGELRAAAELPWDVAEPPWDIYAGYLCATHIGQTLRVGDAVGVCQHISYSIDKPQVRVVLHERGEPRADGKGHRKIAHCLNLDPRSIVEIVET